MSAAPAILDTDTGRAYATGWVQDPVEVARVMAEGGIRTLSDVASRLMFAMADSDAPVFFWDAEKKVLGKVLGAWNQGQVGSCVSFGCGRGAQDVLLLEVAAGEPEQWPGSEVATEPIYGGSRVEVGGGQISGDGSIGAWAAKWVKDWGILVRKRYSTSGGTYDLSEYSETRCRQYGEAGVPDSLEPEARLHPVTDVAQVTTGAELWAALGASKPVMVCSMQGFTTTLNDGFCEPSGQWAHCMEFRGRFVHPTRGKSVVVQNSWGNYLRGSLAFKYLDAAGNVQTGELPEGCFCTTLATAAAMCAQRDTFALAGLKGWTVPGPTPPSPPTPPQPTPGPGGYTGTITTVEKWVSGAFQGRTVTPNP